MSIFDITETWTMDPDHSTLGFSVRHAGISKVKGEFETVEAKVLPLTESEKTEVKGKAIVKVTAQIDSLNTKSQNRDEHLRSADFFDVVNFPEMTFEGTVSEDGKTLEGDLTIKGVTKFHSFIIDEAESAVDPFGLERIGVEAHSRLNRKDFGLTWNAALEAGGVLVSDNVEIEINASFIKA